MQVVKQTKHVTLSPGGAILAIEDTSPACVVILDAPGDEQMLWHLANMGNPSVQQYCRERRVPSTDYSRWVTRLWQALNDKVTPGSW